MCTYKPAATSVVVLGVADRVYDGIGELALGEVLAVALAVGVLLGAQIGQVVSDLKELPDGVDQLAKVARVLAVHLHQQNRQLEQPASLCNFFC